jgi:hypothetical protein
MAKHWWSRNKKSEKVQISQSRQSERWDERERQFKAGNRKNYPKHEWGYDLTKKGPKKRHWWSK